MNHNEICAELRHEQGRMSVSCLTNNLDNNHNCTSIIQSNCTSLFFTRNLNSTLLIFLSSIQSILPSPSKSFPLLNCHSQHTLMLLDLHSQINHNITIIPSLSP